MILSEVSSNLRNKRHPLFENCLKAQSKVKKPFSIDPLSSQERTL